MSPREQKGSTAGREEGRSERRRTGRHAQGPRRRAESAEPLLAAAEDVEPAGAALYVPKRSAARVADCLEIVARASDRLLAEAEWIVLSEAAISATTVLRLEALLVELRQAAALRAELVDLNADAWIAGYRVWQRRCTEDEP